MTDQPDILIKKDMEITIKGQAYDTLLSICEIARRYISDKRKPDRSVDEYDPKEMNAIEALMLNIFEGE